MDTGHSRLAGLPGGSGNPVGPEWASDQGDGGSGGQHLFNLIPFCLHGLPKFSAFTSDFKTPFQSLAPSILVPLSWGTSLLRQSPLDVPPVSFQSIVTA